MKSPRTVTRYRGTTCLNCEHSLDRSDKFCPNCGQVNSTKKLAFDDFFNEFFAGIFAYDSRFRRTLKVLLFAPGKISRDYIHGKRMRYANPFRFYLSASIIFFIIWSSTNDFDGFAPTATPADQLQNLSEEEREELREDLGSIPVLSNSPVVDSLVQNPSERAVRSYRDDYVSQQRLDSLDFFSSVTEQFSLYYQFHKDTDIFSAAAALDSLNHEPSTYNRWAYKKTVDATLVERDPQIFMDYFISKLPFIIFFYLPVFALFIWLLYLRRPFNYMEHLIFAFHVQTTFFVMAAVALVLDAIFNSDLFFNLIMWLFLFYLYKAMRRFYGQKRFKTLVKFIFLNVIFFILAITAAIFSLIASFAIY